MKYQKIFLLILAFGLAFASCDKDDESNPDTKEQESYLENPYFPLIVGNWIAYQIEDINIDEKSEVNDTLSYQIKELIESVIEKNDEYTDYRLERYRRTDASEDWKILNVWQIRKYPRRTHKTEENIEYIRLISPVEVGKTWNGNAFNIYDDKDYEIESIQESNVLGETHNILVVSHGKSESLIDKVFEEEKYAENLGLISKIDINILLNIAPGKPWEEKVSKGTIFRQTIIDYKK